MLRRYDGFYADRMAKMERQRDYLLRLSMRASKKELALQRKAAKKAYHRLVWQLTRQQPLHTLDNFEARKLNSWQLDHKVSVYEGFKYGFPAVWIADITNLRIVPREVNFKKGIRSLPDDLSAMLAKKANL